MAKKKKQKLDFSSSPEAVNQGFSRGLASALSQVGFEPSQQAEASSETAPNHDRDQAKADSKTDLFAALGPKRVLKLQFSKKGRGGKSVTTLQTIEHSSPESKEKLAKELARALGCRVWCEENLLLLQGDQRTRLEDWVKSKK